MQTALMAAQQDIRLRYGMERLLHGLRRFVGVYPIREDDKMPEHDVVWMVEHKDSPQQTILEAIKSTPELWAPAIPTECCVVNREMLRKFVGADMAEYMEGIGANAVDNQAARLRYESEERERRERFGSFPTS